GEEELVRGDGDDAEPAGAENAPRFLEGEAMVLDMFKDIKHDEDVESIVLEGPAHTGVKYQRLGHALLVRETRGGRGNVAAGYVPTPVAERGREVATATAHFQEGSTARGMAFKKLEYEAAFVDDPPVVLSRCTVHHQPFVLHQRGLRSRP